MLRLPVLCAAALASAPALAQAPEFNEIDAALVAIASGGKVGYDAAEAQGDAMALSGLSFAWTIEIPQFDAPDPTEGSVIVMPVSYQTPAAMARREGDGLRFDFADTATLTFYRPEGETSGPDSVSFEIAQSEAGAEMLADSVAFAAAQMTLVPGETMAAQMGPVSLQIQIEDAAWARLLSGDGMRFGFGAALIEGGPEGVPWRLGAGRLEYENALFGEAGRAQGIWLEDLFLSGVFEETSAETEGVAFSLGGLQSRLEYAPGFDWSAPETIRAALDFSIADGALSLSPPEGSGLSFLDLAFERSGLSLDLAPERFLFDLSGGAFSLEVQAPGMPMIAAALESLQYGLNFPLKADPEPQAFEIGLGFEGLTLGDDIWSMIDASGALSRDPISSSAAMTIMALVKRDFIGMDLATLQSLDRMSPREQAELVAPVALVVDGIRLAALGAEATIEMAARFNPENPADEPTPESARMTLRGWEAALDSLVEAGLAPPQQVSMIRAMARGFGREEDGATVYDFSFEDGNVSINGRIAGPMQ